MANGMIIKALSGFYYVLDQGEVIQCRGRGVFRNRKITPLVGDWVDYQTENATEGYIMDILPRKNELVRPPISNVDQALLVFSATQPDFSTALLDRFLMLIESKNITPIICISKMDLLDKKQRESIQQFAEDYREIGYEVLLISSMEGEGLASCLPLLSDKISVIAGQSGVGKSTLVNAICPGSQIKTDEISTHLGRGKHTTRHVELIEIENGFVADTPGFSSLEFTEIELNDLGEYFPEMLKESANCKFRGCLHVKEPNCGVKEAVQNEEIKLYRYEHYLQFFNEIKERKPRY